MSPLRLLTPLLLAMPLSFSPAWAQEATPQVLKAFDSPDDLADLQVTQGTMELVDGALRLHLEPSDGWPQLRLAPAAPLDWKGKSLSLRLKNTGEKPVTFGVRVDDDATADGWKHSWTGNATLQPGESQQFVMGLGAEPMSYGMRGFPPIVDAPHTIRIQGQGDKILNTQNITSVQIFVGQPRDAVQLQIDDLSLLPADETKLNGIIDRYGQSTRTDWPGKIHDDAQLKALGEAQIQSLDHKQEPGENLDQYGGWKKGPQLKATGFFRTEKVDGKWWLVDPEGRLFFSSGVAVVQGQNPTMVTGRESMFLEIPEHGSEMGQFRQDSGAVLRGPTKGGLAYDFGRANLFRKYGEAWPQRWNETTLWRLRDWGFNTLGNWTSDSLKKGPDRLPYTATAGIYGNHARLSDGEDYWGNLHDPFDPAFATNVSRSLAEIDEKVGDDPFCLGYFVENELGFGNGRATDPKAYFGLVYGTLNAPATQPARKALLAQLEGKYKDIAKLNTAWGTKFVSWATINARGGATDKPNEAMKADFSQLLETVAGKYFSVVAAELKKLAPNHLFLGARFSGRPPLEVARASAKNCDVVSFNIYAPQIDAQEWDFLSQLNKPTMIGEFHIGATDRGVWSPGLVEAKTQAERAEMFKKYIESVLDNPNLVGCHWFQWADEPATGRPLDGENYNIGLVDIADTPYSEMVEAAKDINGRLYSRRFGKPG